MLAVQNGSPVTTADSPGVNVSKVPDVALSDVFPESAGISSSAFDQQIVGVIPFVYARSLALTGITNITREQAVLLMTASGVVTNGSSLIYGMPATFLGGTSTNPVYMTGRDSGSGTRITTEHCIAFTGVPTLWGLNGSGNYVLTNGYSSGGLERGVIAAKPDAIGYLGVADFAVIATNAVALSWEGVPFSHSAVTHGTYALWGYEHLVNRASALTANQATLRDALVAAITDQIFQSTNPLYNASFTTVSEMQVERGADGGAITSKNF